MTTSTVDRCPELETTILTLKPWIDKLVKTSSVDERKKIVASHPKIILFYLKKKFPNTRIFTDNYYLFESLVIIGQYEKILNGLDKDEKAFNFLIKTLDELERFYFEIGGIIGYHYKIISLLRSQQSIQEDKNTYLSPAYFDLTKINKSVNRAIIAGIKNIWQMAINMGLIF